MKPTTMHVTDEKDFEAAYEKYAQVVTNVALGYLRDRDMAQDVCQETFLRLGFYFDELPRKKRKPWLLVVAANYSKDLLRKGGKYTTMVGLSEEMAEEGMERQIDKYLKKIATREFTARVLNRLREKKILWYEMVVMVECLGIPKERVAQEYQVSVQSVDGFLRRAREWMMENFGEEYRDL